MSNAPLQPSIFQQLVIPAMHLLKPSVHSKTVADGIVFNCVLVLYLRGSLFHWNNHLQQTVWTHACKHKNLSPKTKGSCFKSKVMQK